MEKIWIIRVKGRISGPFSRSEIDSMIESKKLSIKDEVNKPLKQWVYLKNASELHKAAAQTETDVPLSKKRRPKKDWMEDTVILDSPAQQEEEKTAEFIEQENSNPLLKDMDLENAEVIDYKMDEFEPASNTSSSAQFASLEQVKEKASIKSQKAVGYVWLLIGVLAVPLFFYFFKDVKPTEETDASKLSEARKLFDQGEYEKSLTVFKQSTLENDSDRLKLASLLVQIEGDIYQAQINIEKINHLSALEQSRLQILKGIIESKNNNRELAENLFNAGLNHFPLLAALHKVILNIKDQDKAFKLLESIDFHSETANSNSQLLLFLQAYLESTKAENAEIKEGLIEDIKTADTNREGENTIDKNTIDEKIENPEEPSALAKLLTSPQGDYKQEALLVLLKKQILKNNEEEYSQTIKKILDQDPYLTREYKNDILSYTPRFVWQELLLNLCSDITQNNDNSYFIALKSLCLAQAGQNALALKNIEKARTQSPQDPLISSVFVFVSSQNNLNEHTLLDHSLKQNQHYVLPLILKARFCQKQEDIYCAHSHWSRARQKEPLSLSAIAGEAWSYSKMGDHASAKELIRTGLFTSNRYKPLMQLKDSL